MKLAVVLFAVLAAASAQYIATTPYSLGSAYYSTGLAGYTGYAGYAYPYAYSAPLAYASPVAYASYLYR
ncbi:hypothetical protein ONE63_000755 [Megalurothrips usitatus]|uniref:Uncharacterized protein n=1 Tax=Megalurothrips usitatus TaxID=439358 RepID=A0AAV7Y1Z6_9NEOP|nr:hypothetical protein ONE63_000755 [Megalurothrips usitatus]